MQNLVVKNVNVLGDMIMAAKGTDGFVYAGVSYFCNALGMSKGQKDRQIMNVQKDKTLQMGCLKFEAGVFDKNNETVALRLDFVPLWLAKINITEKMQNEHPELAAKLLEYQLKAKDILADAFSEKRNSPMTIPEQIQLLAQGNVELNKRIDDIQTEFETLKMDLPILPIEAEKITEAVKRKGTLVLGGKESNAYNSRSIRQKIYSNIHSNLRYQFQVKSYKAIKRNQVEQAVKIIGEYKPPVFLKNEIDTENAQQRFF